MSLDTNDHRSRKMPSKDSRYQVDSLQMLCQKVLTVCKGTDCDLDFLQGILNKKSYPAYNGLNRALMRNVDVAVSPPTTITYMSLINMNSADPEII